MKKPITEFPTVEEIARLKDATNLSHALSSSTGPRYLEEIIAASATRRTEPKPTLADYDNMRPARGR